MITRTYALTAPIAAALAMAFASCNSSSHTFADAPRGDGPHSDAPRIDAPRLADAALDAPPGTFQLTVKNYSSWCSVQVGSGAGSSAPMQMVNVAPSTVTLVAKAASSAFELDSSMWHHVDGTTGDTGIAGTQTGTGSNAQSTAAATITNAAKCVWVCCPFSTGGTGCDPGVIGDQCP